MPVEFDGEYWAEHYGGRAAHGVRQPTVHLVTEVADLAPGRALDAGCGEGSDAVWLAARGWRVTAVDLAATALDRGREHAARLGGDVVDRIDWVRADLTTWTPPDVFDLVCSHYVHSTVSMRTLVRRLAASVAPNGTLLVVGHHPSDPHHHGQPPRAAEAQVTAEEMAAGLGPGWDVLVAGTRTRSAGGGHGGTSRDAVLRARRRP
ncbi:class I SAM-dependent methyltransferase [Micromonospora echinospora]|uniref:class I SAM-dependent methyltransferase n=1 Tax=Micromonospora echinospora TaxID=1877 RepID=UPI00366E4AEE